MSCPSCQTPFSLSHLPINQPLSREAKVALLLHKFTTTTPPNCGCGEGEAVVAYCTECDKGSFLCEKCWDNHQKFHFTRQHNALRFEEVKQLNSLEPLKDILPNDVVNCKLHRDEKLDFLCLSCSAPVCIKCALISKKDTAAGEDPNRPTLQKEKEGLDSVLQKIPAAREKLVSLECQGEEVKKGIKLRKDELKTAIAAAFATLQAKLNERERALVDSVSGFAAAKEGRLAICLERFRKLEQDLFHCQERAKNKDMTGNVDYVSTLRAQSEHLLDIFAAANLELNENAEIPAELNLDQIRIEIEHFGYIAVGACPSKTVITGLPAKLAAGRAIVVRVAAMDSSGEHITHGGEVVRAALFKNKVSRSCILATAHDRGDGMYLLTLEASKEGEHMLSVTIHGQHVQGSPFTLPVVTPHDYYSAFSEPVLAMTEQVFYPFGLAFADNGDMFMVCNNKHCIHVFDCCGRYKYKLGKQGSGHLEFYNPWGIAIKGNTLYVADQTNNRVQMLTTSGKFVGVLDAGASEKDKLSSPLEVCVSESGIVYVGDRGNNNRIQVFRSDGSFSHSINGSVSGKGAFSNPYSMALAPNGNLYVAGHGSNNITVFTPEGKVVRSYAVQSPVGIAVDKAGFTLVAGYNPHALYIFDPLGELVQKIEGFNHPIYCVAIAPDGSVWVSVSAGPPRLLKY